MLRAGAVATLLLLSAGSAAAQSTGTWFTRAPLPTPRQEIAHAVVDAGRHAVRDAGIGLNRVQRWHIAGG